MLDLNCSKIMLTSFQMLNVAAVCILWGCTNPFLRRGSLSNNDATKKDSTSISTKSAILKWFLSLWTNWQFMLPFVLNQIGSACYAVLLGQIDLTLALPLCNSLAFVLTAITGYFLGEKVKSPWLLCLGTLLVLSGTALCTVSHTWD